MECIRAPGMSFPTPDNVEMESVNQCEFLWDVIIFKFKKIRGKIIEILMKRDTQINGNFCKPLGYIYICN